MANNYWLEQEKLFLKAIEDVKAPNQLLEKVDFVLFINRKIKIWQKNGY